PSTLVNNSQGLIRNQNIINIHAHYSKGSRFKGRAAGEPVPPPWPLSRFQLYAQHSTVNGDVERHGIQCVFVTAGILALGRQSLENLSHAGGWGGSHD